MELPLLDGNIDADNILPHNTTCANIQMSVRIGDISILAHQYGIGSGNTHPTSELPISPSLNPTAVP